MGKLEGFGLAPIKKEGHCYSTSNPELKPWYGYAKEFEDYYKESVSKPIQYFLGWVIKPLMYGAWSTALLTNAKGRK